jgi:hypothetical protein
MRTKKTHESTHGWFNFLIKKSSKNGNAEKGGLSGKCEHASTTTRGLGWAKCAYMLLLLQQPSRSTP